MKQPERDEILIRVSERTLNIWRVVEKLERQKEQQNGFILENMKRGSRNSAYIKSIIGVGSTVIATFIGWLAKIQGLW